MVKITEEALKNDRFVYLQETVPAGVGEVVQEGISNLDWYFLTDIKVQQNWGKLKSTVLWASQRGCITQLHYDECHNFMVQCSGQKRFILFGPKNYEYLYFIFFT